MPEAFATGQPQDEAEISRNNSIAGFKELQI